MKSFQSEEKVLQMIICIELGKMLWDQMLPDAKQKREVVRAQGGNVKMRHRLRRTLSDVCSIQKRTSEVCLFESLGYGMLLSRSSAPIIKQMIRKEWETVMARRRLLRKVHGRKDNEME